jgi:hypothetical protein
MRKKPTRAQMALHFYRDQLAAKEERRSVTEARERANAGGIDLRDGRSAAQRPPGEVSGLPPNDRQGNVFGGGGWGSGGDWW